MDKIEEQVSALSKNDGTQSSFVDIRFVKSNKSYNAFELFAGAGGLALGLHKAGFKILVIIVCRADSNYVVIILII